MLESSPNLYLWYIIFTDEYNIPHLTIHLVLDIRLWPRICCGDAIFFITHSSLQNGQHGHTMHTISNFKKNPVG